VNNYHVTPQGNAYVAHQMTVHTEQPRYRIGAWAAPERVPLDDLAPSQLLEVRNQIVPFYGRRDVLRKLATWRDNTKVIRSTLLLYAPGGQGKTRLATEFAAESARVGWLVGEAYPDNSRPMPPLAIGTIGNASGLLIVVDYAERWPTELLMEMCGACQRTKHRLIRVLLLARPGNWWSTVRHTLVDIHRYRDEVMQLEPLANEAAERLAVFNQALGCFADALGVGNHDAIWPPDLSARKFGSVLEIHMAALVAADAAAHHETPPDPSEALSDYLLRREYEHWSTMHQTGRLKTEENTMRRTVFVATLTGGVTRQAGIAALQATGIASSADAGHRVLDDHCLCYPSIEANTVLTPLYPDRLAEDFIALQLPGKHLGVAIGDDWYEPVPFKLAYADAEGTADGYRNRIHTMLSEASQRYPHITTDMLLKLTALSSSATPPDAPSETKRIKPAPNDIPNEVQVQLQKGMYTLPGALQAIVQLQPSARPIIDEVLVTPSVLSSSAWIQHIGDVATLTGNLTRTAPQRLTEVHGHSRQELLAALHTIAVVHALLSATHSSLTSNGSPQTQSISPVRSPGILGLFDLEIPTPTAAASVLENLQTTLRPAFEHLISEILADLQMSMPSAGSPAFILEVTNDASDRYLNSIRQIAVDVPEFFIWLSFAEHEQTRHATAYAQPDLGALARLASLLEPDTQTKPTSSPYDPRMALRRVHSAELDRPLLDLGVVRPDEGMIIPTVRNGFVDPAFRLVSVRADSPIWQQSWWSAQAVRDDLDLTLAAHLTSIESTMRPMMILGQPGSGKSLLLRVIADRLPATQFTVLRVPLRIVDASSPLYDQVQQALEYTTGRRLDWSDLSVFGDTTVRVLLLDGVDEMIQTGGSRVNYLEEIAEFQRREAALGRPVAVIVTGRTVLADRIRVPPGALAMMIESFDDRRIEQWLQIWNATNASAITDGKLNAVPTESVLAVRELAQQPILLLMLTLYWAAHEIDLNAGSAARLYHNLVENVVQREVTARSASLDSIDVAVTMELWRLGLAAFAAFNRGRQAMTRGELSADLAAIFPDSVSGQYPGGARPVLDDADLLLGSFFFIYESQARYSGVVQTSFEFLHATFGEYLVAESLVRLLAEMARINEIRTRDRAWHQQISDDLLYALLSHRPLSERPTVLRFAEELVADLSPTIQQEVASLLRGLVPHARSNVQRSHYTSYHPTNRNTITAAAAYSANLILLRVFLFRSLPSVSIDSITSDDADAADTWGATVRLWGAALNYDQWASVISALDLVDDQIVRRKEPISYDASIYIAEADLRGDPELARVLRAGFATKKAEL